MRYQVVSHTILAELTNFVESYIRMGWEPLGGVCVYGFAGGREYYQAIIKRDPVVAPEAPHG